jgi:limiting CO2-inducible B/C-like protein
MDIETLKKEITRSFPNAEVARIFFAKQNIFLEEQHGFTPENTRFAEGGCSDEINEAEYILLQRYWGERFKFGGLAGYCHSGKTGLAAVSHHVPDVNGSRNLLLVAGPHVGYFQGAWGEIARSGQSDVTSSCGSLVSIVNAGYDVIRQKPDDILDRQQQTVEQIMLPYLKSCSESGKEADILEATKFLMKRVDEDLMTMVKDLEAHFEGKIAVITGITINTVEVNFFSPSIVRVFGKG